MTFGCKLASIPMEANVDLCLTTIITWWSRWYKRLIEKLIYLTVTRPDITFVIGVLSRFTHQLKKAHWSAALRNLAYLKSCPGKGLVYRKHGHVHIFEYSDSSYVDDRGDRKSTIGHCIFVGGILWLGGVRSKMLYLARVQKLSIRAINHTACEMV